MGANYASLNSSRKWTIKETGTKANEVITVNTSDAPIVWMDFSKVLGPDTRIATITSITSSPTTTESNEEISDNGHIVSWKVPAQSADTYTFSCVIATSTTPAEALVGKGDYVVG